MLLRFADWFVWEVLGLEPASRLGATAHFFVYDSIKIFGLLVTMIFIIGIFRTYIPQEKMKQWLSGKKGAGHVVAALFGAVTPFCSCSSVPLFLGFLEAGVPLGVTFSFLITSPLINEYLVVLMAGFFGWRITLLYVFAGISIGVGSGLVLGRMRLEKYLVADLIRTDNTVSDQKSFYSFRERVAFGWGEAVSITRKIWVWILAGVGVGAWIHNFIPQELIQQWMAKAGPFSVPLATLLGVPMYGSCAAIVPIAVVLFQKGIPLGTALAFMMATVALSLPEAIMLRRAMRIELIGLFFLVTSVAIMGIGYLFNLWPNALS